MQLFSQKTVARELGTKQAKYVKSKVTREQMLLLHILLLTRTEDSALAAHGG